MHDLQMSGWRLRYDSNLIDLARWSPFIFNEDVGDFSALNRDADGNFQAVGAFGTLLIMPDGSLAYRLSPTFAASDIARVDLFAIRLVHDDNPSTGTIAVQFSVVIEPDITPVYLYMFTDDDAINAVPEPTTIVPIHLPEPANRLPGSTAPQDNNALSAITVTATGITTPPVTGTLLVRQPDGFDVGAASNLFHHYHFLVRNSLDPTNNLEFTDLTGVYDTINGVDVARYKGKFLKLEIFADGRWQVTAHKNPLADHPVEERFVIHVADRDAYLDGDVPSGGLSPPVTVVVTVTGSNHAPTLRLFETTGTGGGDMRSSQLFVRHQLGDSTIAKFELEIHDQDPDAGQRQVILDGTRERVVLQGLKLEYKTAVPRGEDEYDADTEDFLALPDTDSIAGRYGDFQTSSLLRGLTYELDPNRLPTNMPPDSQLTEFLLIRVVDQHGAASLPVPLIIEITPTPAQTSQQADTARAQAAYGLPNDAVPIDPDFSLLAPDSDMPAALVPNLL